MPSCWAVKVRIGYGLGVRTTLNDEGFARVVDALETLRFDSLWLSERIGGSALTRSSGWPSPPDGPPG